jgi:hypothetical protein
MTNKNNTLLAALIIFVLSNLSAQKISSEFKKNWFDGNAEISSYSLNQSRYGEIREGSAVLIYVTEDFLGEEQVKANKKSKTTIPVLKLNRAKKFLTGIYPYSIMTSTFSGLLSPQNMIKNVASIQEWCGQSYLQINSGDKELKIISHSYFEGEADQEISLKKTRTEDELWNLIRMTPNSLPLGELKLIPSLEMLRLDHKEIKTYDAITSLNKKGKTSIYTITYPSLKRSLSIEFSNSFPHAIEGWEEKYTGKGDSFVTTAKKIHTERRQYWRENNNASKKLRTPFKID